MPIDLAGMFDLQASFNKLFFDASSMTQAEREHLTMVFASSLQKEVGDLLEGINYRQHRLADKEPDRGVILHESVDVWRYLIGIMNLWDITPAEFKSAYDDRDLFLRMRHEKESVEWDGRPVLIVDMDDVLTNFRADCTAWAHEAHPGVVDDNDTSYYSIPEELYREFIELRKMKTLSPIQSYVDAINALHDSGVWIHILTARPESNLILKYDSYTWLRSAGVKFDRVSFSSEKYLWLAQTEYYKQGKVIAAVDDSPKHAFEYAQHGVTCLVPVNVSNFSIEEGVSLILCKDSEAFLTNVFLSALIRHPVEH
jgi:hypothetical protein